MGGRSNGIYLASHGARLPIWVGVKELRENSTGDESGCSRERPGNEQRAADVI